MDYVSRFPEDLQCRIARAIYRHVGVPIDSATDDGRGRAIASLPDKSSVILYMIASDVAGTKPLDLDDARALGGRGEITPEALLGTLRRYRERSGLERLSAASAYVTSDLLTQEDRSFLVELLAAATVSASAPDDRAKLLAWLEARGV